MKKDLIFFNDLSPAEILALYDLTRDLKEERRKGVFHHPLAGKTLGMIFSKQSTRTRISFEVGMFELGGYSLFLTADQLQLKRGETIADSARVLSRYLSALVARTHDHSDVEQLAKYASIPVINGLTDLNHPLQVLTDIFTIQEKLGKIDGVKVAYIGDGNNVAYSWIAGASLMGINLVVASPPEMKPRIIPQTAIQSHYHFLQDPFEAVQDADIIYTDVWVSMGDEAQAEKKLQSLKNYQVTQDLVSAAKKDVLVMHCLPAHRGEEITSEVLDGKNSIVFDQAENRLHVQKAILQTLITRNI